MGTLYHEAGRRPRKTARAYRRPVLFAREFRWMALAKKARRVRRPPPHRLPLAQSGNQSRCAVPLSPDNSAELKKKYLEANARLIRKAKALGVGIAIGSDAHSPKDQGNGFDVALKMLDDAKVQRNRLSGRRTAGPRRAASDARASRSAGQDARHIGAREQHHGFRPVVELGLPEQVEIPASARRESARAAREAAAAKRSSGPTRSGKRADAAAKSTSRRTPESSTSSGKAKAARTADPAPAKKKPLKPAGPPKTVATRRPSQPSNPRKHARRLRNLPPSPKARGRRARRPRNPSAQR